METLAQAFLVLAEAHSGLVANLRLHFFTRLEIPSLESRR